MAPVYRFDDVEVDVRNFRALKAGKALSLEPKSFNVCVFLIEQRGRLVEKQELIEAVWGDAFVTENVLTRAITQLRKALGDDAKDARYIETVPTRGYRFVAEVQVETNGDATPGSPPKISPAPFPAGFPPATSSVPARHPSRWLRYTVASIALLGAIALIAAGIFLFRGRSAPEHLQVLGETQLTACDGLCMFPTLAPDGASMAYSADHGKGFEIFVRQLGSAGKEVQITADGGQNMQAAWSPDGKSIAYTSRTRLGIWLVPAFGGPTRKLTDFGSHPSWSRDGEWIAFQSGPLKDLDAAAPGVFPPSTIWIMHSDGTAARQVTQPGHPEGGHGAPSWSPDGHHIVFVAAQYGVMNLWSIASDGTGLLKVGLQRSSYFFDPIYSPDGKSILYGNVDAGNYRLWKLAISPATSQPLGEPQEIMNSGELFLKNLSISNDGKKLVYAALSNTSNLHSISLSPGGPATEPRALVSAVGCRVTFPVFSPDGSRIAFAGCIGRSGVNTQISVMNSDGSDVQQLTVEPGAGNEPNWYPDGRHILFFARRGLYSVDTQTRAQEHVADFTGPPGKFALSPDGTQVALNPAVGGVVNIWLMNLATQARKQITFDKEMLGFPSWSRDGKFLAAELQRGADSNVVILPSSGGAFTQLTFDHGSNWPTGWSADDDKVIFTKQQDDGIWNVWSVSRSTKIEKQLTHYNKLNAYVRYAVMSPRGNQLVYEYNETHGNIWMLQFK